MRRQGNNHVTDDFAKHNDEVRKVWQAFNEGNPTRVPIIFGLNPRFLLLDEKHNPQGVSFQEYSENPDVMLEWQLRLHDFVRHNMIMDAEMGLPSEGWDVGVDFQNYYEAAWFGCEVRYAPGEVPDSVPMLTDERKNLLFDRGIPDPLGGLMASNLEFAGHFQELKEKGFEYKGKPLRNIGLSGMGTDGPFTVACNIRGATQICFDIYEDPDYVHRLLDYIVDATIARIQALRRLRNEAMKTKAWGFADDSISLLSLAVYREFVLPPHRRLVETFSEGGPNSIHLCGDATRHFKTLRDELNVMNFDTGFPVDFGALRKELGPDVQILGGPSTALLRWGTVAEVRAEVERILKSGIMEGGKFVLREGNNMAPGTPLENIRAVWETGREFGRYGFEGVAGSPSESG